MKKRYFLVPANSEPTPGRGKTLHGVDSHSVEELIKIDNKYGIFIKKNNCERYDVKDNYSRKEKNLHAHIKKWFAVKRSAFAHIPIHLKRALFFLFLYLVAYFGLTA